MKRTVAIITILLLTMPSVVQSQTDRENIYFKAVAKHIGSIRDSDLERTDFRKKSEVYFIEEDPIVTDNLPSNVNGQNIQVLTRKEIIKKIKYHNSIKLLAVRPVQWRNGQMEIHVIEFNVSGNKRNLNYVNQMSGTSFVIKPTPDCQGFGLEKVE